MRSGLGLWVVEETQVVLSDTLFAKVHLIPGAIPGQLW